MQEAALLKINLYTNAFFGVFKTIRIEPAPKSLETHFLSSDNRVV